MVNLREMASDEDLYQSATDTSMDPNDYDSQLTDSLGNDLLPTEFMDSAQQDRHPTMSPSQFSVLKSSPGVESRGNHLKTFRSIFGSGSHSANLPTPPVTQQSFSKIPEQEMATMKKSIKREEDIDIDAEVDNQGRAVRGSDVANFVTAPKGYSRSSHGSSSPTPSPSMASRPTDANRSTAPAPPPNRTLTFSSASSTGRVTADIVPVRNINDVEDNDVMLVDERECSEVARLRFREQKKGKKKAAQRPGDDVVYIKTEKRNDNRIEIAGESNKTQEDDEDMDVVAARKKQATSMTEEEMLRSQRLMMMQRHRKPAGAAVTSQSSRKSLFRAGFKPASNPQSHDSARNSARAKRVAIQEVDDGDAGRLDDTFNEKAELENLMTAGHEDDDHGWMEGDDEENESGAENEEITQLRKKLDSLEIKKTRNPKKFTEADEFELNRVLAQIGRCNQRQLLAARRIFESQNVESQNVGNRIIVIENEMFVPEDKGEGNRDKDLGHWDYEDDAQPEKRKTLETADESLAKAIKASYDQDARGGVPNAEKPKKKKGGGRKMAKNAREVEDRRREKEREKSRKKKERADASAASKSGSGPARKTRGGKSSKKGEKNGGKKGGKEIFKPRIRKRQDGDDQTLQTFLNDLIHTDIIADRAAQKDYGIAPEINERTKEKQLKALMESVPETYDTHRMDNQNAKVQKRDLHRASKRFGFGMVKAVKGKWLLKGMKSALYHHQLLATDWMVGRELSHSKPYGGLLADAMGLGKTLETLALMVGNPPSPSQLETGVKTTLLVVPSSAIRQWQEEIKTHCDWKKSFPKILHWKAKKDLSMEILEDMDVVITSYAEVMNSYPFPNVEELRSFAKKGGLEAWLKNAEESQGDLHRKRWYRVVLDEAHAIKNYRSRTSQACQALNARYRWALSGTPIQNRLEEFYPYFRFLQAEWTDTFDEFKRHFCDPDADDSNARLSVVLSIVMMRRTMKDRIMGRPIVELPRIYGETKYVNFSKEERVLYRVIENRFRDNLNRHFVRGTAEKNYAAFMVQLLRLRQCTAHPFLLESTVKNVLNFEDVAELRTQLKRLGKNKKPIYEQIDQWIQEGEEEEKATREMGVEPGGTVPFGRSDFGKYFKMGKFLDSLDSEELMERVVCKLCGDLPRDAQITDCNHIFCEECLREYMHVEAARNEESDYTECPSCQGIFVEAKPYKNLDLRDDLDVVNLETPSQSSNKEGSRRKSKKVKFSDPYQGNSTWLKMCLADPQKYMLPSAKTIAFKSQVLRWFKDAPTDKILVFVQFRMEAKILGLICEAEKWEKVYFTGDMNGDQRHEAVRRFHNDPSVRIMIAGLKVGGQALNLTCANRVISTSLWFNHCVEQQAIGRVFRIGQHKETHVRRFVVRNTVDERLLDMQADKVLTIDRAMQDTEGTRIEPLSMTDLASLFGHLRKGDDGKLHVDADYEAEEGEGEESEGEGDGDAV